MGVEFVSSSASSRIHYPVLLTTLFISGFSSLMNQIAWQRAVKIYLANSETLSTMIIVLVFMLGLGLGSMAAARRAAGLLNPFLALGMVEMALGLANVLLLVVLGDGLRGLAVRVHALASAAGVPAGFIYAAFSFLILIVPCFLMGLTVPLAAEAAQRQLDVRTRKAVVHFFALNTAGAVAGTIVCGLLTMPLLGQKMTLWIAALGNVLAGFVILSTLARNKATRRGAADRPAEVRFRLRTIRFEEVLAFALGFTSLAYEVYLLRILGLAYTPLPWIFAVVLCLYLLSWSIGVALSDFVSTPISVATLLTAAAIGGVPFLLSYQRFHTATFPIWGPGLIYFVPCLGFGVLFGLTITRYTRNWGRDVGAYTALNTLGSAAGIVFATYILFELHVDTGGMLLAAALAFLVPFVLGTEGDRAPLTRVRLTRFSIVAQTCLLVSILAMVVLKVPSRRGPFLEFSGRDGVVEITRDGRVFIGGLWHSMLFRDGDDSGSSSENIRRKKLIALLPLMAHEGATPKRTLNIGMGTGSTARILAKSRRVDSVDTYEIVRTVADVIEAFPEETLGSANRDKIHVYWQDARTGLLTRDATYDIITQSPLYLKQAGSSFLLSKEYFELLKSRLRPGGIAGIYSNSQGNAEQALLVRRTVSEVFAYYESFANGYFILASDRPIDLSEAAIRRRIQPDDPVAMDLESLGLARTLREFDRPKLDWLGAPFPITDDHPLVEYPELATLRLRH